jgi:hypothetical protein
MLQNSGHRELRREPDEFLPIGSDEQQATVLIAITKSFRFDLESDVFHVSCSWVLLLPGGGVARSVRRVGLAAISRDDLEASLNSVLGGPIGLELALDAKLTVCVLPNQNTLGTTSNFDVAGILEAVG